MGIESDENFPIDEHGGGLVASVSFRHGAASFGIFADVPLFEGELARALAMQFELEYIDLVTQKFDRYVARMLPLEVARRMFAVPVRWVGENGILVAVADPCDIDVASLERILKHNVTIAVGERTAIQSAWRALQ